MKKTILLIIFLLSIISVNAQYNYQGEVTEYKNLKIMAENTNSEKNIEQVMEKFTEQRREQLQQLNNLTAKYKNDKIEITGTQKARFMGIFPETEHTYKYTVNEFGEIKNNNFWSFLWRRSND